MKILGFRSKKKWKMLLAAPVYAFVLLIVVVACTTDSDESTDKEADNEKINPVIATEVNINAFDEASYYTTEIEVFLNSVIKTYDSIWDDYWRTSWSDIDTSTMNSSMETLVDEYSNLNRIVIDFKVNESSMYYDQYNTFRENISKAISYRGNAGTAILHALNGKAELDDRMEEAEKSIELSDSYMLKSIAPIASVEQELGLLK